MKKTLLLALGITLASTRLFAQFTFDWMQVSGQDQKQSVMSAVDAQDNLIVTGYLQSHRMFTRKYAISGAFQWEVQDSSGILSNYEKPNWINCDANNNILVVGNRYSIGSSYDYPNAIVAVKYSASGALLWRTVIPISILINSQTSFSCRSEVDGNGNLYIGTAISNGVVLYKLDHSGNVLFSNFSSVNAPKNFNSMRIRNGRIAVVTSSGTPNVAPVFVWDTSGTLLWTANAVGALAADVELDENENVFVLGSLYHQVNPITWDYDAKLTKFSPAGNLLWSHTYDFGGYNFVTRMTYVNHRISAIGYGNATGLKWQTFQTDTNGTLLWSSPYIEPTPLTASDSYPHYVLARPTGEVIVTGVGGPTPDPLNPSYNQMPIVHYSSTGVQTWVSTPNVYGGTGLATLFASDGSMFAISSRNMTVYHYSPSALEIGPMVQVGGEFTLFPNPITTTGTLEFRLERTATLSVSIVDFTGRTAMTLPAVDYGPGVNRINLTLPDLNKGIYLCRIRTNEKTQTYKLIKN